jgi:hypothetical protein
MTPVVGANVGCTDGLTVGAAVGGDEVGLRVGAVDTGARVGLALTLGEIVGFLDTDGLAVGDDVGKYVGSGVYTALQMTHSI